MPSLPQEWALRKSGQGGKASLSIGEYDYGLMRTDWPDLSYILEAAKKICKLSWADEEIGRCACLPVSFGRCVRRLGPAPRGRHVEAALDLPGTLTPL